MIHKAYVTQVIWLTACLVCILPMQQLAAAPVRITIEELKTLMDEGAEIAVVDVRSRLSYEEGHIPGALSLPLEEIEDRQDQLPRDRRLVLY